MKFEFFPRFTPYKTFVFVIINSVTNFPDSGKLISFLIEVYSEFYSENPVIKAYDHTVCRSTKYANVFVLK